MQPPHIRGWRKAVNTQQTTDTPLVLGLPNDIRKLLTSATSKVLWQATLISFEQSRRKTWEPFRITLRAPAAHRAWEASLKIVISEHCLSETIIYYANPSHLFTRAQICCLYLFDRTGMMWPGRAGWLFKSRSPHVTRSSKSAMTAWPLFPAIWLTWNKGSPKVLGSELGVDSWLLLLGGFYRGNLLHWDFDPDTGDSREPLWIPLREAQQHFHGFLCSEMLMEHFAAGLHWKLLLGKLCLQGRLIPIPTRTFSW